MSERSIHGLIDRCSHMEQAAWTEIYELIQQNSKRRIELRLQNAAIALDHAEDVLQELYIYLRSDGASRLRSFRGSTRTEFAHFLRGVAQRFAANYVRHWQRTAGRERQVDYALMPPDRRGGTTHGVLSVCLEFEACLNRRERRRWAIVLRTAGLAERPERLAIQVPARTMRHWRRELYCKFLSWNQGRLS